MIFEKVNVKNEESGDYVTLSLYIHDTTEELNTQKRPMVLICPGGGYVRTSDREAEIVALQFMSMGYHAAVLRYSVAPIVYPTALLELGKSVAHIRGVAEKYNIDNEKIAVVGFSAGGHLVANYCMFWKKDFVSQKLQVPAEVLRPNAMILGYPVITSGEYAHKGSHQNLLGAQYEELKDELSLENQISDSVPKSFIWHTYEDQAVPVENSILLVSALVRHKIPTEFHMFEKGGHGLGLANKLSQSAGGFGIEPTCECWIDMVHAWLENL